MNIMYFFLVFFVPSLPQQKLTHHVSALMSASHLFLTVFTAEVTLLLRKLLFVRYNPLLNSILKRDILCSIRVFKHSKVTRLWSSQAFSSKRLFFLSCTLQTCLIVIEIED